MTTHEAVLALVTGSGERRADPPTSSRRLGAPAGVPSGEELIAGTLAETGESPVEDHLVRLARREALLHRLAVDRQRRRRRIA